MKIILNKRFGGFGVSKEGYMLYAKKKGLKLYLYKFDFVSSEKNIFKKTNEEPLFANYFTKDMGDNIEISDEDYNKFSFSLNESNRTDPILIEVLEELDKKASGGFADLQIIEIPDNCYYIIDEYDGFETIYYSNSEIYEK